MLYPNGGFTKFPNRLRGASWRSEHKTVAVYFTLRMHANHRSDVWSNVAISPGELCIGRKVLAAETGLTENEVRTALNHLQKAGEITIKTTNKFSVISFTDKENWGIDGIEATSKNADGSPARNCEITTVGEVDTDDTEIDSHTNTYSRVPSESEVVDFFTQNGIAGDPVMFWLHYQSIGWKLNGNPIVDWHYLAYKWERNGIDDGY